MFLEHYNLIEQPFGVSPDTRFLYLNHMYREALASLWCGIQENRGFMALVAEPGMGKTTLLFQLLQRLKRTRARTVFLFQTCCNPSDLVRYLLQDMGIWPAADLPSMHQQLNDALVQEARAGRQFVFVVDEAQNLGQPVLESIRLLSDFETSRGKLLQIILAGQPQLISTLMKPELLQLTQRISVTSFLDPLDPAEVAQYVRHRLSVAGYQGKPLFTPEALQLVAQESKGIPRLINNICYGAMSTTFALGERKIGREVVKEVAADQSLTSLGARMNVASAKIAPAEVTAVTARATGDGLWFRKWRRVAALLLIALLAIAAGIAISSYPQLLRKVFAKKEPIETTMNKPAKSRSDSPDFALLPGFGSTSLQQISALNPGPGPDHIHVQAGIRRRWSLRDSNNMVTGVRGIMTAPTRETL